MNPQLNDRNCLVYTYHLPFAIRREICNLLDADQSWRILGGQFIGLNTTQLTLIGQAYMRNGSPTDELLSRLDSSNVRIIDFCYYLKQMNHCRALEILKPYSMAFNTSDNSKIDMVIPNCIETLDTPTPSFVEQPAAIMGFNDGNPFDAEYQPNWQLLDSSSNLNRGQFVDVNSKNKNEDQLLANLNTTEVQSNNNKVNDSKTASADQAQSYSGRNDPGEEIVRLACVSNKKRTSISDQDVVNQLRLIMQINYNELKQASNDFSQDNILGNGGFASVYRGNWKGTDVAIKRLKCNLMDQALNELTILNSYRIDNILPIYGISIDGPEACLVYQFMSEGSLEDRLSCKNNTQPLTWNQRAFIGEGVAKGLYYLHTLRKKPLVHGDVKSANVLLDSQFVPKLGDFGLARQVFRGKNPQTELCTSCTVSSIHGTSVYLPAEYLRHKILSPAVDVYSYGIVLLEMATGKRAYDGKRLLIDIVEDETSSMSMGQISYSLKDSLIADDTQNDLKIWYELLIRLGLNCAHKIKKKRPHMGQVLNKFVEFRNNNPDSSRTLTPVVTMNDNEKHPLANHGGNNNENNNRYFVTNNLNSTLMSVEEETNDNNHDQMKVKTTITTPAEASVEAMIPLLTELGIETKN